MTRYLIQIGLLILIGIIKFIEQSIDWIDVVHLHIILNYFGFVILLNMGMNIYLDFYRKRKGLPYRSTDNITSGIHNIYIIIIAFVALATVLSLMGINIRELLASLSIIAAAIALISKEYLANVISGMIIAFSNDVTVGDFIKVGNYSGKVINMSISAVTLLTDDDDFIIVPNNIVYASGFTNNTKLLLKKTSIEFEVNIASINSIKQLEEDLIATLEEYHHLIKPDSYNLKIGSINHEYVDFKFQYMLNEPDRDLEKAIRKKVIRRVVQIIKKL